MSEDITTIEVPQDLYSVLEEIFQTRNDYIQQKSPVRVTVLDDFGDENSEPSSAIGLEVIGSGGFILDLFGTVEEAVEFCTENGLPIEEQ